jgi:hypothetical protein
MSPTAIGRRPPSDLRSGVSLLAHSITCPGAVPATMRPVSMWTALMKAGTRRTVARRWCVHPDRPRRRRSWPLSRPSSRTPHRGMSSELGPSVGPNGSSVPAGCLSWRAATTSLSTVATAAVPASRLAALPSRPFSTFLTAVEVAGVMPLLGSGLGQSTQGYGSRRALSPCFSPGASPAFGRARMLKRVSSPGSARKALAKRSTHPANTPAVGPDSGLCTVGRSPR